MNSLSRLLFIASLSLGCFMGSVHAQTSVAARTSVTKSNFHQWAATPPMGWNSWDCFGPTVVESEVKANADYMAKYLKPYGWNYVVVDIRWYVANDKAHGYNEKILSMPLMNMEDLFLQ